jgi:outer membrane lipoprotein SlyB
VIESTRKIEAPDEKTGVNASGRIAAGGETGRKPGRNYEITIRLRDGSMRVITDANPARWRHGERVTIIAGLD